MSKKQRAQEQELDAPVDLQTLNKKELRELQLQLEIQSSLLDLEQKELELRAKELSYRNSVDKFRFSGRGIAEGQLSLDQAVTETAVDYLTEKIDAFVHAHADLSKKEKPGLTLVINSPGGSVFEGWRLFDELRAASLAGHVVTTKVRGMAASMAAVLVQAGDHRIIGPESYLMIHEPSTVAWGKAFEVKEQARFIERLNDQIAKKFSERSGKSIKAMKAIFEKTDAWFSAEESVKHGFADRIG